MAAYYLKYRPQSLDDLIGQEAVKKTLLSAFQSDKLSHAYVFVGPRGTGKTSTARILAKMVNCESQESRVKSQATSDYPCNQCPTCISITDGSNLDLIEVDAASNRGIEDIRALREKVKLSPTAARKKVYIIDEAHMLTLDAFNALLKTLEEPPSHALFIMVTTDVGKMPQTILSRVQRLDFKLATAEELLQALKKITTAEKIDIDEQALKLLVKKAEGSFRDGVKMLDQAASLQGKITAKILEENLKSSQFDDVLDLIKAMIEKNRTGGLLNLTKQLEQGVEVKDLMRALMDNLRNLMLIKNGLGEQLVKPGLVEDNYQELVKLSEDISNQDLIKSLDILQNNLEKLKTASIPSLPLELAVVEICGESSKLEDSKTEIVEQKEVVMDKSAVELPSVDNGSSDLSKIKEKWTFVLETIRPYNFSLEALLRAINIRECTDTQVVMEVPYSFHQRILEVPKNRDLLESILSDILGRNIHVATTLGNRPQRKEDIVNIEVAADDEIIRAAAEIFNSDTIN